jgi:hypothetical protein
VKDFGFFFAFPHESIASGRARTLFPLFSFEVHAGEFRHGIGANSAINRQGPSSGEKNHPAGGKLSVVCNV